MELIYTTAWTRERIKSDHDYIKWLSDVKDGDDVLIQSFVPPGSGDFPFELWKFEAATAKPSTGNLRTYETKPYVPETGKLCYWNSNSDWGKVFPARIIPCSRDIPAKKEDFVFCHKPVYEPFYFNCYRFVYLVERGSPSATTTKVRKAYPHNYSIDCETGELYHCFANLDSPIEIEGAKFLYSQYCDR